MLQIMEIEIHRTARWLFHSVGRRFEPDGANHVFAQVIGLS